MVKSEKGGSLDSKWKHIFPKCFVQDCRSSGMSLIISLLVSLILGTGSPGIIGKLKT